MKTASPKGAPQYPLGCPFCSFQDEDSYFLALHVETVHPEGGESPFIVKEEQKKEERSRPLSVSSFSPSESSEGRSEPCMDYVECPCGEFCLLTEFDNHLDMHNAEGTIFSEVDNQISGVETPQPIVQDTRASLQTMQTPPPTPPPTNEPVRTSSKHLVVRRKRAHKDKHNDDIRGGHQSSLILPGATRTTAVSKAYAEPRKLGVNRVFIGRPLIRLLMRSQKAELGPHADEDQMPDWLRKLLEKGAKVTITTQIGSDGRLLRVEAISNEIHGIIPVLSRLCMQDESVERAFFCHPCVTHVVKMAREGGFCGYRNIQMMISYIKESRSLGHEHFPGRIPSILRLQDMIEHAWDLGYGVMGRIETGGIMGTRKYIGTPEVKT